MVKQSVNNTNRSKSSKSPKKFLVQIRRVGRPEKVTKVSKSEVKSKESDGYLCNSNKKRSVLTLPKTKKDRKSNEEKQEDGNSDKFKFSIVDYLRTSISDKLGVDEVKKKRKYERKKEKSQENKESDEKSEFGSIYELLDNDPSDFYMDIPLDVVITTDVTTCEDNPLALPLGLGLGSEANDGNGVAHEKLCENEFQKIACGQVGEENELEENGNGDGNVDISMENDNDNDNDNICLSYGLNIKDQVGENKREGEKGEKGSNGTHFLLTDTDGKNTKNCIICNAAFSCGYKLKRHMLSHSDERKFFCETCGNGFKTNYHLSRHKTNVHSIVGVFECDLCDLKFSSKLCLREHKLEKHFTVSTTFHCSICNKMYASKKGLKRHEKQVHVK